MWLNTWHGFYAFPFGDSMGRRCSFSTCLGLYMRRVEPKMQLQATGNRNKYSCVLVRKLRNMIDNTDDI